MKKTWLLGSLLLCASAIFGEGMDPATLSKEEEAAVAAILANARQQELTATTQKLPPTTQKNTPDSTKEVSEDSDPAMSESSDTLQKCTTVAFVDIDAAFNAHPRTVAVKEQIRLKILSKEDEVRGARQLIEILQMENQNLARQLREITPFYENVIVEAHALQPCPTEKQDTLAFSNLINRLTFAGSESMISPFNTGARIDDLTARITANKKIIEERGFFIDNYRYQTREEILQLEKKEVNEILQDIYSEIKSFAKKRNIGAIVRKDEVLYGEKPVNVTQDFISRLKKSKKYRKRGN